MIHESERIYKNWIILQLGIQSANDYSEEAFFFELVFNTYKFSPHMPTFKLQVAGFQTPNLQEMLEKETSHLPNRPHFSQQPVVRILGDPKLQRFCRRKISWRFVHVGPEVCPTTLDPKVEESNSRGHDTSHPGGDQKGICFWQKQGILRKNAVAKDGLKVSSINPPKKNKRDDKTLGRWIFKIAWVGKHK